MVECEVCLEPYAFLSREGDRRPVVVCSSGHTYCYKCACKVAACPTCRQPKLNPVIPNRALIQLLENSPELQQASGPATEPAYSFYDPEPDQFEENDSKQLRKRMVKRIRLQAIAPLVSENVLKAMETVPRHYFVLPAETPSSLNEDEAPRRQKAIKDAYDDRRCGPSTAWTDDAPNVLAILLSAANVDKNESVLVVGGEGGYAAALVADLVGYGGRITAVTANEFVLNVARERLTNYLRLENIRCRCIWFCEQVKDGAVLSSKLANHPHHNAIVYLGSVSKEPSEMVALLKPCGRLVVPVLLAAVPAGDGSYSGQKIVKITLNHFREVTRDVVDGVELRLPEVM